MKPDFRFMNDTLEYMEASFTYISPNDDVTTAMRKSINEMIEAEEPTVKLVEAYASAILNGLKYGNWPK